jgi:hypothetical protein
MHVKLARCTASGAASCVRPDELYEHSPEIDFFRDILQGNEHVARVVKVPPCGSSEVETPRTFAEHSRHSSGRSGARDAPSSSRQHDSLR